MIFPRFIEGTTGTAYEINKFSNGHRQHSAAIWLIITIIDCSSSEARWRTEIQNAMQAA